jgi:hypothetical protein
MSFDKLANRINESLVPEARPVNPEFQKWKAENPGVPTYKFFKMQRDKKLGTSPAPVPAAAAVTAEPAGDVLSKDPATERTRLAVADFLSHNPNASVDEIIDAIAIDSTEETPLNLDPAVVKAIVDQETSSAETDIEEPSLTDIKKDELARKYDRMRQALYRARGLKAKPGRRSGSKDEPGLADDDEGSGEFGRGINMRDEPVDPNEL